MNEFTLNSKLLRQNFYDTDMVDQQYENCVFTSCVFEETNLKTTVFDSCSFKSCRIILPKNEGLTLRNTTFEDCRLTGFQFGDCNQFGFSPVFTGCLLESCQFANLRLNRAIFSGDTFRHSDFTNCELRNSNFKECSFEQASFQNCDLRQSDFRESENYSINPESNRLKGSKHRLPGALSFLPYLGIEVDF